MAVTFATSSEGIHLDHEIYPESDSAGGTYTLELVRYYGTGGGPPVGTTSIKHLTHAQIRGLMWALDLYDGLCEPNPPELIGTADMIRETAHERLA